MTVVPADVPGTAGAAHVHRRPPGLPHRTLIRPMRSSALLTCATLLVSLVSGPADAQPAKPSLVVVIVVDQMRRDYIQDYGPKWTKGLRRLVDEGAWFTSAAYPYGTTLTCAGHATISTGTLPSTHGIISNEWWDRATQQAVACTSDSEGREVPYGERQATAGGSARMLQAPTLASAIGKPGGRVVVLSLKRASAAMLAGQGRADAVLWFQGGGWSSSTAWAATPEKSLLRAAERAPIEQDFGLIWDRAAKKSDYKFDDKGLGEKPPTEWDVEMPHALKQRDGQADEVFLQRVAGKSLLGCGAGPTGLGCHRRHEAWAGRHDGLPRSQLLGARHRRPRFRPRSHEVQDVLLHLDEVDRQAARPARQARRTRQVRARLHRRSRRRRDSRAGHGRRARRRADQDGRGDRARRQARHRRSSARDAGSPTSSTASSISAGRCSRRLPPIPSCWRAIKKADRRPARHRPRVRPHRSPGAGRPATTQSHGRWPPGSFQPAAAT